ncbi:CdaR family protein [Caproiciproducens sp. LBM24188]|nr:hypothetical protein [Oscillospiraceae bacterium]HHV31752.1 hypothetical protein [Clostridiales bacterium]
MIKRPKKKLGNLFNNDKFVLLFSVFASVVLWLFMVSTNTEDFPHAIENVPVNITLSEAAQKDGLKVFSPTNSTATVYIKGNSLIVNQIQASDLEVVAPLASTITSPGTYPVNLVAQKVGTLNNFEVVSTSPSQAIVSVDRYKEKTFPIECDIKYKSNYQSNPSYFVGSPVLSVDTVNISGPEKDISQISKVMIQYEISDTLTENKSFTSDLILYDTNGNKLSGSRLKMSDTKVDVTIPVLFRKVVPLNIGFTNKPEGLLLSPEQVTISPSNIEIAGPKNVLDALTDITLTPLDFTGISPMKNTFNVPVSLPTGCKNLSNTSNASVTLNLGDLKTRDMTVSNFTIKNLAADKTASIYTKSLSVTVVGPEIELSKLTENNLVAQIDMAGKENFTGHTEMPVTISISNSVSSWVYGSYMANIGINQK